MEHKNVPDSVAAAKIVAQAIRDHAAATRDLAAATREAGLPTWVEVTVGVLAILAVAHVPAWVKAGWEVAWLLASRWGRVVWRAACRWLSMPVGAFGEHLHQFLAEED